MDKDRKTSERAERESRHDSLRAAEERMAQLRAQPRMHAKSVFHMELIPRAGWVYQWVRTHVREGGDPDLARESGAAEFGWTPVPASRHPELMINGLLGDVGNNIAKQRGYIAYGGQILVECPEEHFNKKMMEIEHEENSKVDKMIHEGVLIGNPAFPVVNQSYTVRGNRAIKTQNFGASF